MSGEQGRSNKDGVADQLSGVGDRAANGERDQDQEHHGDTFEVVEEEERDGVKKPKRGVYLLPNLITSCALFSGFYSIIASLKGLQDPAFLWPAAFSIFVAMVFDTLDGRVARLTNTSSSFGEQYDSLADAVSFGVAPAVLAFSWGLHELGKFGWFIAFIYMACGVLRLARFNVQIGTVSKKYFIGIPIPAAAALVSGMVWLSVDTDIQGFPVFVMGGLVALYAGLMMVSNVQFYSFKELDVSGRVPLRYVTAFVLLLATILWNPPLVLFLLFFGYSVSGLVGLVKRRGLK